LIQKKCDDEKVFVQQLGIKTFVNKIQLKGRDIGEDPGKDGKRK
jgi:hypothetical protein